MDVNKVVAVDFDKTICDSTFPEIHGVKDGAREALARIRAAGYWVIVWSCRTCKFYPDVFALGETLDMNRPVILDMLRFLDEQEIPYDEIDDGMKGKPYAAFYIDDKAVRFEDNWREIGDLIAGPRQVIEHCTYCGREKVEGALCLCGNYEPGVSILPEKLEAFEGGATRSQQSERFDLIPPASLRGLARRLALGASKHGERNWESGGEAFRQATISHLMKHLLDYMQNGNQGDANTDAIICNAAFLCFFEDRNPFKGASSSASE